MDKFKIIIINITNQYMSEHLLIDINRLYTIYSADTIIDYYNYNFFPSFTSINIDIIYDILNSLYI